jgi:hypothetical protein
MAKTNAKAARSNKSPKLNVARQTRTGRRQGSNRRESTIAIIDRLLAGYVPITINGEMTQVPATEAIILQLLNKGMSGSARAWRALLRYQDFASRRSEKRLEVAFIDTGYTTGFANSLPRDENG